MVHPRTRLSAIEPPVSVRLKNGLCFLLGRESADRIYAAELLGVQEGDFRSVRHMGRTTWAELQRIVERITPESGSPPSDVIALATRVDDIERRIAKLEMAQPIPASESADSSPPSTESIASLVVHLRDFQRRLELGEEVGARTGNWSEYLVRKAADLIESRLLP